MTPVVRTLLDDPALRRRWIIRPEPHCAPPCPARLWRLETAAGEALNASGLLRRTWHRPPYALTIRLMQYEPGSTLPVILDEATIGTRRAWVEFSSTVTRTATRLLYDAAMGRSRGPSRIDAALPAQGWLPGWLLQQARRWQERVTDEWWSLGVSATPLPEIMAGRPLGAVHWFHPHPSAAYLADPFPWHGFDRILCEEMPRDGRPGRIVSVRRNGDALEVEQAVLDDGAHHSYPSTFAENGIVYCLPESVERGATRLYRLQDDGGLSVVCDVAPDRRLADPTLFRWQDRLWIACTDLDLGSADNLCLLHAAEPSGPWIPHAKWPVRIDVRGARPGGMVFHYDGHLLRPGQDCARTYGAAVALHAVTELTPTDFAEILVARLEPDDTGPFPSGLHTLVHDGVRFWVDGKRFVFDPMIVVRRILRRLRVSAPQRVG
ncbi:MAG: hypothetical protein U1E70_21170 [Acetobacteraceae bacterium]